MGSDTNKKSDTITKRSTSSCLQFFLFVTLALVACFLLPFLIDVLVPSRYLEIQKMGAGKSKVETTCDTRVDNAEYDIQSSATSADDIHPAADDRQRTKQAIDPETRRMQPGAARQQHEQRVETVARMLHNRSNHRVHLQRNKHVVQQQSKQQSLVPFQPQGNQSARPHL